MPISAEKFEKEGIEPITVAELTKLRHPIVGQVITIETQVEELREKCRFLEKRAATLTVGKNKEEFRQYGLQLDAIGMLLESIRERVGR